MFDWLTEAPLWLLGLLLFALQVGAALLGYSLNLRPGAAQGHNETQEGYVVAGVLTLLGLLVGFTFALALDRFEARRLLVIDDANAIETLYLRAQLLDEPHRTRFSGLLTRYTDNHVRLAEAEGEAGERLLADNQRLLVDLWAAAVPAFDTIRGIDFSSTFVDSVNRVIELDVERKSARQAQIPGAIFGLLFFYLIVTSFMLGYVLSGPHGRISAAALLLLFTLALLLLSDINRPITGFVRESQAPMQRLQSLLHAHPPARFQQLRAPAEGQAKGH